MIMGELNIDTAHQTKDTCTYLSDLRDTFSLTNIINDKACYKARKGASIDVLLTNRPGKFHKTSIFEAGISDHHTLHFVLTIHVFHLKLSNIEITKTLLKRFFSMT